MVPSRHAISASRTPRCGELPPPGNRRRPRPLITTPRDTIALRTLKGHLGRFASARFARRRAFRDRSRYLFRRWSSERIREQSRGHRVRMTRRVSLFCLPTRQMECQSCLWIRICPAETVMRPPEPNASVLCLKQPAGAIPGRGTVRGAGQSRVTCGRKCDILLARRLPGRAQGGFQAHPAPGNAVDRAIPRGLEGHGDLGKKESGTGPCALAQAGPMTLWVRRTRNEWRLCQTRAAARREADARRGFRFTKCDEPPDDARVDAMAAETMTGDILFVPTLPDRRSSFRRTSTS